MASSWKGALSFGGFPVAVALHKRTASASRDGFKMLDPVHYKPVHQTWEDVENDPVKREDTVKGINLGNDTYRALTPAQVEQIEAEGRSSVIEPLSFAPLASLPLDTATANYVVLPDNVPGAESSVNALWNGLRAMKAAYVATLTIKTHDAILAVYAADDGLRAVTLPFVSDLASLPTSFTPEVNRAQAAMVKTAIEDPKHGYDIKPFDPTEYVSCYAQRRARVIEEVLAGVEPTKQSKPITPGDLMAALAASQAEVVADVKPKRARAKA